MATDSNSKVLSDPTKSRKDLLGAARLLRIQYIQIEALVKQRKLLEDQFEFLRNRWISDIRHYRDEVFQLKREAKLQEAAHNVEKAKSELMLGFKHRDVAFYKLKLEAANSELDNFKLLVDYLSRKCSESKDLSRGTSKEVDKEKGGIGHSDSVKDSEETERRCKALEGQVKRLKHEYSKLSRKKDTERDSVWNQYKMMESDYTSQLKFKSVEVEQAKERIEELLVSLEELQSANKEKDNMIEILRMDLAELKADSNRKNEEISKLSSDLDKLRKLKSASATPSLVSCTVENVNSSIGTKSSMRERKPLVKIESSSLNACDPVKDIRKVGKDLKRKENAVSIADTPKLFTSMFKVPKLKNSSPRV